MVLHALMQAERVNVRVLNKAYDEACASGFIRHNPRRGSERAAIQKRANVAVQEMQARTGFVVWKATGTYMLDAADRQRVLDALAR